MCVVLAQTQDLYMELQIQFLFKILRQGLGSLPRLGLNFQSSCFDVLKCWDHQHTGPRLGLPEAVKGRARTAGCTLFLRGTPPCAQLCDTGWWPMALT